MNFVAYWFQRQDRAQGLRGAKPLSEQEAPGIYQMVRELTTRADLPMPRLYVIPSEQPNAFATGRSPKHSAVAVTAGDHQAALRGRAARRDRPRARPHQQPRHPHPVGRLDDRRDDHLPGLLLHVVRRRRRVAAGPDRKPGDGAARAARGDPDPARGLAPARVRGRRDRRPDHRQPRVAGLGAAAARGGRQGDADAGQPGDRVDVHRQAVQGRRDRGAVLDPPADRGARPAPAPDAPARLRPEHQVLGSRRHLGVRGSPAHPGGDDEPATSTAIRS